MAFLSGWSINRVKNLLSLILYIVTGRRLKILEGKVQCILMMGDSKKKSTEKNPGNESILIKRNRQCVLDGGVTESINRKENKEKVESRHHIPAYVSN